MIANGRYRPPIFVIRQIVKRGSQDGFTVRHVAPYGAAISRLLAFCTGRYRRLMIWHEFIPVVTIATFAAVVFFLIATGREA
jgi:hypothetical protein